MTEGNADVTNSLHESTFTRSVILHPGPSRRLLTSSATGSVFFAKSCLYLLAIKVSGFGYFCRFCSRERKRNDRPEKFWEKNKTKKNITTAQKQQHENKPSWQEVGHYLTEQLPVVISL